MLDEGSPWFPPRHEAPIAGRLGRFFFRITDPSSFPSDHRSLGFEEISPLALAPRPPQFDVTGPEDISAFLGAQHRQGKC